MNALHLRGVVDFSRTTKGVELIEFFFVPKKDGKLRMVADCRRSNCRFSDPASVSLCTGETLGALELEEDASLFLEEADLCNAFYHLQLPKELRQFFSLRPVRAGAVGITELDGKAVTAETMLHPRLAVVPADGVDLGTVVVPADSRVAGRGRRRRGG